jgi:hypothetical protein
MADLNITIQENITLPNNNKETLFNTIFISNINQVLRRTDTIATNFSGSGIEILKFVDSEEQQTAGSFVKSNVKYIRITNLSPTYNAEIYLIATDLGSTLFNINPGKTIMLNDADINVSSTTDYLPDGYVDETYYSSFTYIDTIKAKAISGSVQLEYFVAST